MKMSAKYGSTLFVVFPSLVNADPPRREEMINVPHILQLSAFPLYLTTPHLLDPLQDDVEYVETAGCEVASLDSAHLFLAVGGV